MAYADNPSIFTRLMKNIGTFFCCLRDRFLQEDIISVCECLHSREVMEIIGGSNNHCISKFRPPEDLSPIGKLILRGDIILCCHLFASHRVYIRNADDSQRGRILCTIGRINRPSRAGTDDDRRHRPQHFSLLRRQSKSEAFGIRRKRDWFFFRFNRYSGFHQRCARQGSYSHHCGTQSQGLYEFSFGHLTTISFCPFLRMMSCDHSGGKMGL